VAADRKGPARPGRRSDQRREQLVAGPGAAAAIFAAVRGTVIDLLDRVAVHQADRDEAEEEGFRIGILASWSKSENAEQGNSMFPCSAQR